MLSGVKKGGASLLFLCLILSGCGALPADMRASVELVGRLIQPVPTISEDKLKSAGHLRVTFENRQTIYMVLGRINPDNSLTWASADGALMTTLNLRPIETSGFEVDLRRLQPMSQDPVALGQFDRAGRRDFYYRMDVRPADYRLVAQGNYRSDGTEPFTNRFTQVQTKRYIETWRLDRLDWQHQNEYWVAQDGVIVKSRVQLHPQQPMMELSLASYDPSTR